MSKPIIKIKIVSFIKFRRRYGSKILQKDNQKYNINGIKTFGPQCLAHKIIFSIHSITDLRGG